MADFWDEVAQDIASLLASRIPKANTGRMSHAIKRLQVLAGTLPTEGRHEMTSSPPPAGAVWILQSDLDADATALQGVYDALKAIVAGGSLAQADESALNTVLGNLEGLATPVAPTPPAPEPTPSV